MADHDHAGAASSLVAPPALYLPVDTAEDGSVTDITMLRLGDGRVALAAYTALDRFVAAWGEHKPWVLVQTAVLAEIRQVKPFDLKFLDADIPAALRPGAAPAAPAAAAEAPERVGR